MVDRSLVPYVGVLALGVAFVAAAVYGFLATSGDPASGSAYGRLALTLILGLGVLGLIVASADLYRHHLVEE